MLVFLLFFHPAPALTLSQEDVIEKALSLSPHIQKIRLKEKADLALLKAKKNSLYDFKFFSNIQYGEKNNPEILPFEPKKQEERLITGGFEKKAPYGFSIKAVQTYSTQKRINSPLLSGFRVPGSIYGNRFAGELNADLAANIFGRLDRKTVSIFQAVENQTEKRALEEAEELALRAASFYQASYRACSAFRQVKKSLKAYERLVKEINDKKKYRFLKPGEGPQVLAEYENLKQEASQKEHLCRDKLSSLFVLLKINPPWNQISFKQKKPSDFFASLKQAGGWEPRSVQILREQIKERELKRSLSRADFFPKIQFQGKSGLFQAADESKKIKAFPSGKYFYELNLNFRYAPLSKTVKEKASYEKYKLEEAKTDLEMLKREEERVRLNLRRKLKAAQKNFQSSEKALKYQKQAFQELQQSFFQGRADVFDLIRAENKLRESEMRKTALISEFHFLTARLSAALDLLAKKPLP